MSESAYKYEVAFSFLKEDEPRVVEINDLLQDRLSTFLYSKNQEALAGTDGEKTFNDVFAKRARIVAVLHRQGWGRSPWTRIEETAIRGRGFEEGYDFAIMIPVDSPPSVPAWFPKNRIWVNLARWGAQGAAAVIEARVQEQGGETREESLEDRAARIKRQKDMAVSRKTLLTSDSGVAAAESEVARLFAAIEKISARVATSGLIVKCQRLNPEDIEVYGLDGSCLNVVWQRRFVNSLEEATLGVSVWDGPPPKIGRIQFDRPPQRVRLNVLPDSTGDGTIRWRHDSREPLKQSDEMAEYCVRLLMDQVSSNR